MTPTVYLLALDPYALRDPRLIVAAKEPEPRRAPTPQLPRTPLLRLSEKGYEQWSERGFGRYREDKMRREIPFQRSVGLQTASTSEAFRTVSLGTSMNRALGCIALRRVASFLVDRIAP